MNKKIYAVMSSAALTAVLATAVSTTAFAKVDAFLVNNDGKLVSYDYNELMEASLNYILDDNKNDLYESYLKGSLVAFHDDKTGYVKANDVMNASMNWMLDEHKEAFSLDGFTAAAKGGQLLDIKGAEVTERTVKDGKIVDTVIKKAVKALEVESVSAVTNSTSVNVTFSEATKADKLEGKKLVLELGENKVEANFKSLSQDGKVATFTFDEKTVEGTYIVSSKDFSIKADTKVLFDKTAPTVNAKESKFVDYKTMKVSFSEKVTGTPVVKVNGKAIDGKNIIFAKDGMSLEVKNEEGFKAGIYSVSIEGLKDVASNTMAADSTAKVVKEASKVAKAEVTTEKLAAKQSTVAVIAVDQYGETIPAKENVTVKAFKGTMPVFSGITTADAKVEIKSEALVKDANIKLELFAKDKDEKYTVKVGEKTLSVFQEISRAASIDSIERTDANKDKEIKAGDGVELTANVLDQFGNKMTVFEWKNKDEDKDATQRQLRWTTDNKEVIAFAGDETKDFKDGDPGKTTIGLVAKGNGNAIITAYLPDGSVAKTFKLSVVDGELAKIDATAVTSVEATNKAKLEKVNVTVNEKDKEGKVLENSIEFLNKTDNGKDIPVRADSVNFEVAAPQGFEAKDINVEKVADENGNLTGLKITSNRTELTAAEKAGDYKTGVVYTIKVKSNVKEVAETNFNVTSKIDSAVKTISNITFKENELTALGKVQKAVTFVNQYGEKLNVKANDVTISSSDKKKLPEAIKLTTNGKDGFDVIGAEELDKIVTGLEFNPKAEGIYKMLVTTGVASNQIEVPVVKAAGIKDLQLGASNVDVIANDKLDAEKPSDKDNIVVEENTTYTLIPINFVDQYGNKVTGKKGSSIALSTKQDKVEAPTNVRTIKLFEDLKGTVGDVKNAKYIGIAATDKQEENIYVTYSEDEKVVASAPLTVNVKEARKINSVTVDNKSLSLALNGKGTIKVVTKDQYGRLFKVTTPETNIQVKANPLAMVTVSEIKEDKDIKDNVIGYKFDVKAGQVKGNVALTVKAGDKTETVNVSIDATGKLIDGVKIDTKDVKTLYSTERNDSPSVKDGITLNAIATDKDGNEVPVPAKDLIWEVVSVDGTINEPKKDSVKATLEAVTNKDNPNVIKAVENFKGKAVIKVTTTNQKSNTITLNFDNAPAKIVSKLDVVEQKGNELVTNKTIDEDATKEGIQIIFGKVAEGSETKAEEDKEVTITIAGNTQYGDVQLVKDAKVLNPDPTVVTVKEDKLKDNGQLTLTANGSGSTEVYVKINGQTLTLDVSVEGPVAKELDGKNNEKQALAQAVAEFNAEVAKYVKADYEANSWNTFNVAITAQKGIIYENGKDGKLKEGLKSEGVNKSVQAIKEAAKKLVTKADAEAKALKDAKSGFNKEVAEYQKDNYEPKSWTTFEAVIKEQTEKVNSKDITLDEVTKATAAVKEAAKKLDKTPAFKAAEQAAKKIEAEREEAEKQAANEAIQTAERLIQDQTLTAENTNLLTVLNAIEGMSDTGVTLAVKDDVEGTKELKTAKIAKKDGAITKGTTKQIVTVTITIRKVKGTDCEKKIKVTIPNA